MRSGKANAEVATKSDEHQGRDDCQGSQCDLGRPVDEQVAKSHPVFSPLLALPPSDAHGGEERTLEKDSHGQPEGTDHKHEEAAAVKLSPTAQDNVGLKLAKVELSAFERTITVPAMVEIGRAHV